MRPDLYCSMGEIEGYTERCAECNAHNVAEFELYWRAWAQGYFACAGHDERLWQWADRLHSAGHTWAEIASVLHCSASTVSRQVRKNRPSDL